MTPELESLKRVLMGIKGEARHMHLGGMKHRLTSAAEPHPDEDGSTTPAEGKAEESMPEPEHVDQHEQSAEPEAEKMAEAVHRADEKPADAEPSDMVKRLLKGVNVKPRVPGMKK